MGILILRIMFFKTLLMKKFKIINDFYQKIVKILEQGDFDFVKSNFKTRIRKKYKKNTKLIIN